MKKNDIFKQISNEDAARIAAEYPTGDKFQRDHIFSKVEKRVNRSFTVGDEVRGVDVYRPRTTMKIVSAAAAVVLAAGATGVGYKLFSNGKRTSESSSLAEVYEQPTEEIIVEATTVSNKITNEELLEKIHGRNYESFDRINMKYRETMNGVSFMDGVIKRDGLTGNESEMKTWTYTPEYFDDIDSGEDPEELAKNSTHNEMFFIKDMFICFYENSNNDSQAQYEITDRSNWLLDQPTAFSDTYSEYLVRDYIDHFEIKNITENTVFLGRDCTDVFMTYDSSESPENKKTVDLPPEPEMAPEAAETTFDKKSDKELSLTIDNETGIILKAKIVYNKEYYEEFEVKELLIGDDAELPENGEYIRNKIANSIPINDSASYDLSVLD